jgi:hypothetical protein
MRMLVMDMERYLDHHRAIVVSNVRFQATGSDDLSRLLLFGWSFHLLGPALL